MTRSRAISLRLGIMGFCLLCLAACAGDTFVPLVQTEPTERHPSPTPDHTPPPTKPSSPTLEGISPRPTRVIENQTPRSTGAGPCPQAAFVEDVTVPDGTEMLPDELFLKIWRVKNTGECTWPGDLRLEYVGADNLSNTESIPLRGYPAGSPLVAAMGERTWSELVLSEVLPGEIIDVPLMFQAPELTGDYVSVWSLRSPQSGQELLQVYVQIRVDSPETPEPTRWGGEWRHFILHADDEPGSLSLQETTFQLRGYFLSWRGELYLLEGGLFDGSGQVKGTFGPPYHDGFPFEWQLLDDGDAFQGIYQDQVLSDGAWCGARRDSELPVPCTLTR